MKANFEPPINDLTPERWVLADEELAIVQRALFELPAEMSAGVRAVPVRGLESAGDRERPEGSRTGWYGNT